MERDEEGFLSTMSTQASRSNLESLVQPIGGLMSRVTQLATHPGEPNFPIYSSSLGDVNQAFNLSPNWIKGKLNVGALNGAGGDVDPDLGRIKAIAEGLERYSSCVYDERQFIWATAEELGDEALDLDTLPRCSATEMAHPRCLVLEPDKRAPMRWVRGISLTDSRPIWIPAILVYLHLSPLSAGERISLPISTGCAAHLTLEQALLSGLCEVIERDSISLVWLQQLSLPRIELDEVPAWLEGFIARNEASRDVTQIFFDATTELGVPTVYSLQLSPGNQTFAALVMCSTELDPAVAIGKVMRESASSRIAMQQPRPVPESWDDFNDVFHGAVYMGHRDRLPAYHFLVNSTSVKRLSEMPLLATGNPRRDLRNILSRLSRREMEAFAVDLTTDEAKRAGMWVVKTFVPALQPLSFSYRSRYLGHPRLYEAPQLMGYRARPESEINFWPQPFA